MTNALQQYPYFDCGVELAAAAWQLRIKDSAGTFQTATNSAVSNNDYATVTQNLYANLAAALDADATLTGNYGIYFVPTTNRVAIFSTVDFTMHLRSATAAEALAAAGLGFRADTDYDAAAGNGLFAIAGTFQPKYIWSPQTGIARHDARRGVIATQVQDHGGGVTNAHSPVPFHRVDLRFPVIPRWFCRADQYTTNGATNYRNASLDEFLAQARGGRAITFFDHRLLSDEITVNTVPGGNTLTVASSYYDNVLVRSDMWFSSTGGYAPGLRRHITAQSESGGVTTLTASAAFPGASAVRMSPAAGATFYLAQRGLTGHFAPEVYNRSPYERIAAAAEFYDVDLPMIVTDFGDPT